MKTANNITSRLHQNAVNVIYQFAVLIYQNLNSRVIKILFKRPKTKEFFVESTFAKP